MELRNLITEQYNLLLTDNNYNIPEDIEMEIEDQTGLYRDFCTDTEQIPRYPDGMD